MTTPQRRGWWSRIVDVFRDIRAGGTRERQRSAEYARQTIAVWRRHKDGRAPAPAWILEDAARCVLAWTDGLDAPDREGWGRAIEGANAVLEEARRR